METHTFPVSKLRLGLQEWARATLARLPAVTSSRIEALELTATTRQQTLIDFSCLQDGLMSVAQSKVIISKRHTNQEPWSTTA